MLTMETRCSRSQLFTVEATEVVAILWKIFLALYVRVFVYHVGEELWPFWSYEIHSLGRSGHNGVRCAVGRQQRSQHQVPLTDQRRHEAEF